MTAPNTLFVLASLAAGWVALFPLRHRLGGWGYHLAAYPVGLVGWAAVAALHSLIGRTYSRNSAVLALALSALAVAAGVAWVAQWADRASRKEGRSDRPPTRTPWWSFPAYLAVVWTGAWQAARAGAFYYTDDSWAGYEAVGIRLRDTGEVFLRLMNERALLVPSMHAGHRALGGDWLHAAYPVLAGVVLLTVGWAVWRSARSLPWAARMPIVLAPVALLGFLPQFLAHSLYVHSHMLTAACLLLAVAALAEAGRRDPAAWLPVAGLAASGVALARPDGLWYVLVVLLAYAGTHLRNGWGRAHLLCFYAPLALVLAVTFGAAFAALGLWTGNKLDSYLVLSMLALAAAVAVATLLAGEKTWLRALRRPGAVEALALSSTLLALLGVAIVRTDFFSRAMENISTNLFALGKWGLFWTFAVGVVAIGLLFRLVLWEEEATGMLVFTALLFTAFAVVLHSGTHPGRVAWADSFNRIAFHAAPLVSWLFGALLAGASRTLFEPGVDDA